jgi:hypothetical protein
VTIPQICIVILILAILLATSRYLYFRKKNTLASSSKLWRVLSLVILQTVSAALLYFCLFPPHSYTRAERLVILTANADAKNIPASTRVLALPEASVDKNIERVADLATALRRYPGITDLHIIGAGLTSRDIDGVKNMTVTFSPSELPLGITELWFYETVTLGTRWEISGRVNARQKGKIELLNPGNTVVATSDINEAGNFIFSDTIRSTGLLLYRLRLLNQDKKIIEILDVPIHGIQSPALRVLSLSGGPNAEIKYLHRWAMDAGVELDSQISLGAGLQIASAAKPINATTLNDIDLLLLDERAWSTMNSTSKQAVIAALRNGMGVLVRITGPLNTTTRNEFRALGFTVNDANIAQGVRLNGASDDKTVVALSKRPLVVSSIGAVNLLQDNADKPLALWRAEGRGRIGLWWLGDSYRLVLNGDASTHGQLWQNAISTLARARDAAKPLRNNMHPRIHERSVFCDVAEKSYVKTPSENIYYLIAENDCAAYWPKDAGWHSLVSGNHEIPFYVQKNDAALALKTSAMQEATKNLTTKKASSKSSAHLPVAGSHWPWFMAWLLVTALLWALERSRIGVQQREASRAHAS